MRSPDSDRRKTNYKIKVRNLSYKLPPKVKHWSFIFRRVTPNDDATKYILKNVNCEAKPGEITAIAGPSGAGKTTLLEVLAGMVPPSLLTGQVLINDHPMNRSYFRSVSGYVTQDDYLFPLLTVEETLTYSARLRLSGGTPLATARVKSLMRELGLIHVANSRIGSGISGGERRRVSIGVDLVHDPVVLFIDEPTSGLDSSSALHVILLLKSMAINQGKTIVLSIHQPGFRIIELFDRVVLLSSGTVLHHGSLGLLEERLKCFGHSMPLHVNVLEFAIEVAELLLIESEIPQSEDENEEQTYVTTGKIQHVDYAHSQAKEVLILGQRFSKIIIRTKQLFVARIMQSVLAGLVLGNIFSSTSKSFKLQAQIGFFAFTLTFLLSSTTEGLPIYLQERRILLKETSRGAYRVSSYIISNTFVFLPFLLIVALLYATPVYWLVGLRREIDGFFYFSLVVYMVVLMSNSFVAFFSALVPNFIMGSSLIAGIIGSFFLFSGYFIGKDDIPKCWVFMHYLSLFKYPFECFMINEYGGERGRRKCLEAMEGGGCFLYGDGFLVHQGLKNSQKWSNLVVMLGFIFGYRFLCFMVMFYRCYRTRT